MIIYKIENKINSKIYIGLTTKGLSQRISSHIKENKSYIQKALNKYGLQSFNITIIDNAQDRSVLLEKEKYWIKFYNCKSPNGYNLTDGGDGLINPTKEVREQISKSVKALKRPSNFTFEGRKHSYETKEKISNSLKDMHIKNPEVRKKISNSNKGKIIPLEVRDKIRSVKQGKKRTDIIWNKGKKMSDIDSNYINPMKGKKRPDLSERNRTNKGRTPNWKNPEERAEKISLSRRGKKYKKEEA